MKKCVFILIIFIFSLLGLCRRVYSLSRKEIISQELERIESKRIEEVLKEVDQSRPAPSLKKTRYKRLAIVKQTLNRIEFELSIGWGYLYGDTSYEINFPVGDSEGRSKLEFPFGNWLIGGGTSIGYYPWYLGFEFWTNICERVEGDMKDRDWLANLVISSTESDADAEITIFDGCLLYSLWQGRNFWGDVSNKLQKGKAGLLLGYKYEEFKYDIIGVRNVLTGGSSYQGQKVLDYKVKYHIPYLGLSGYYSEDFYDNSPQFLKSWGLGASFCWSPYLLAKDRDDHILRYKIVKGKTKGYGILFEINTFLKTKNDWVGRLGFDCTYIETDGEQSQYWYGNDPASAGDETGNRVEGINLQIKSLQYLFWGSLEYRF